MSKICERFKVRRFVEARCREVMYYLLRQKSTFDDVEILSEMIVDNFI